MTPYATVEQLTDYMTPDPVPGDAERLLRDATVEVDRLLLCAVYDTDADGIATDATIKQAIQDATCELARWWDETGDSTGAAAVYTSASIGGVSLGRGAQAGGAGSSRIGPHVYSILAAAGLATQAPYGR